MTDLKDGTEKVQNKSMTFDKYKIDCLVLWVAR